MENVAYLENEDINSNGTLKSYVSDGKPCVLMLSGNFCGYCKKASPEFEKFAKSNPNITSCVIVIDGSDSEKKASRYAKIWDPFYKGVPTFLGFDRNGKYITTHSGGRDFNSLQKFSETLK